MYDIVTFFTTLPQWFTEAAVDSLKMLPFLLLIFFVIEFIEFYFSEKIEKITRFSATLGPLAGAILASFPQCGFSVIAAGLYTRNLITKGTLLAVFLSTSDEAIPILLSTPEKIPLVIKIIGIKIIIAVIAGYLIDLIFKYSTSKKISATDIEKEKGCCNHEIHSSDKTELIIHPIKHTLNVFIFVFLVTLAINFLFAKYTNVENFFFGGSFLQPVAAGIIGLIPNCSVSIAIVLMYIKGALSLGSAIAGLCSAAGVGLLVLIKKNKNKRDTVNIIALLAGISILCGITIQIMLK